MLILISTVILDGPTHSLTIMRVTFVKTKLGIVYSNSVIYTMSSPDACYQYLVKYM